MMKMDYFELDEFTATVVEVRSWWVGSMFDSFQSARVVAKGFPLNRKKERKKDLSTSVVT
jgi:hypothetical protein